MEYSIALPWDKPPLTANQKIKHWGERARLVKMIRESAFILTRASRIPRHKEILVTLHYQPRDRRNRDAHNLYPTVKALVDGIVDAGVVPDDNTDYLSTNEPVIHPPIKGQSPRMWMTITERNN